MFLLLRTLALSFVLFVPCRSAYPNAELSQQTSVRETVLERFKLSRDCKCLLLPVQIQGNKYWFVLDTGSTITCYDTSLRSLLGDPVQSGTMHTSDGKMRVPLYRPPAATIGRFDLPTKSLVYCVDLGMFRDLSEHKVKGAVGMDFLKEHVFRIDFVRAEVTFLQSVGTDPGIRVPFTFDARYTPQVEVTLPGLKEKERFYVDTGYVGSTGGHVRADVFNALVKRGVLWLSGNQEFGTALGRGVEEVGCIKSISLGNQFHKELLFSRANTSALSLLFLSQYDVVTFDCRNKAIYFKKVRQSEGSEEGRGE